MGGYFLPCKGHICTLKHLGECLWEAAGAEGCSTSLLLWGIFEGDNSSWAALSYFHVPPVSCQAGVKKQVLQCYLSIPGGWKRGLFPKGGTYLSQLQLFAPQVPPPHVPKASKVFPSVLRNQTIAPKVQWQQFLNCAWVSLASPWFLATKPWPVFPPGSALIFNGKKKPLQMGVHKVCFTPVLSRQLWDKKSHVINWITEIQPLPQLLKTF